VGCAGGRAASGGAAAGSAAVAGALVEGLVTGPDGEPIEGAQVFTAGQEAGALTDARGAYRIAIPAAGAWLIVATRTGYTRDSLSVIVAAQPVVRADFVLEEAPVCQGRCVDGLGNPIACC
jgi:hypothetical protein